MPLSEELTPCWNRFQDVLCPSLADILGPLNDTHRRFIAVLDLAPPESFVRGNGVFSPGRPQHSRFALARSFMAKAVYNLPTTRALIDRVQSDPVLRRLCGWETVRSIPSEATFSRAFAELSLHRVPERIHEALIRVTYATAVVGHISRDSTAIKGREKARKAHDDERRKAATRALIRQTHHRSCNRDTMLADVQCHCDACSEPQSNALQTEVKPKRKRGRPRKGESVIKEPGRLQKQRVSSLDAMLADLPRRCDVGSKKNAKGFGERWTGYKLHIDSGDGEVPISCILTSASLHDSQVAIPLSTMSGQRVDHLYELMDAAYDSKDIAEHSHFLGHVPIIDVNVRRNTALKAHIRTESLARRHANFTDPTAERYKVRSTVERVNSSLKDTYGGRNVRVRGHAKVFCHLMFGVLAMTVEQLMRLAAPD